MSRLTNRSVINRNVSYVMLLIKNVKVIEPCRKTIFVLHQLTCINTYIKCITEEAYKKTVNYVQWLPSWVQNNLLGPEDS